MKKLNLFGKEGISFWSMLKNKTGWKSEKQRDYFRYQVSKCGCDDFEGILNNYKKGNITNVPEIPEATQAAIWIENEINGSHIGKNFGGKTRRIGRLIFVNDDGIVEAYKIKFQYNDKKGWSGVKGFEKIT